MKQSKILLTVLLLIFAEQVNSQSKNQDAITGNIRMDINHLLPDGQFTADIMDSVKQDPRQVELSLKLQVGIKGNYDWFVEYVKTVPPGKPMPYHPHLGVTQEEYKGLQNFMNHIEYVSTGQEVFQVIREGSTISFRGNGKLEILNTIVINLENDQITFGEYTLQFADTTYVTDDNNGLRSKWKGYTWRYEFMNNKDSDKSILPEKLQGKQYKFTIGKLEKNSKTYMSIKGIEFENNIRTVEFELPLVF